MKRLLLLSLLSLACFGQSLSLTGTLPAGETTAKPGDSVTLNVNFTSGTSPVSDLEFAITLPAGWTYTPAAGAASNVAAKQIQCAPQPYGAPNPTTELCVIVGLNQNVFTSGVVATFTSTIPQSQGTSTLVFVISNNTGADLNGNAVQVAASGPFSLSVVVPPAGPCDLNGDGKIDQSDVQISLNHTLDSTLGLSADINGDGVVNVVDVRRIENAVVGGAGACRVGP